MVFCRVVYDCTGKRADEWPAKVFHHLDLYDRPSKRLDFCFDDTRRLYLRAKRELASWDIECRGVGFMKIRIRFRPLEAAFAEAVYETGECRVIGQFSVCFCVQECY